MSERHAGFLLDGDIDANAKKITNLASVSGHKLDGNLDLNGKDVVNTGSDSSVKAKNKLDDTHRQNNTTNTTVANQVVRKGWGFIQGDGANWRIAETVNFGITFDDIPIVVAMAVGELAGSDPDSLDDFVGNPHLYTQGYGSFAAGSCKIVMCRKDEVVLAANTRYGYTWIAVGSKA